MPRELSDESVRADELTFVTVHVQSGLTLGRAGKGVAVGKDAAQIKVGDRILYKTYSTTDVKVEGEDYILVKEEDILATVK